jgi:hypothetical protein
VGRRERVEAALASDRERELFGTECCQILQIPASAFRTSTFGETLVGGADGYVYTSSGATFVAPVLLPTGSRIRYLDLYYRDVTAFAVRASLHAFSGGGFNTGDPTDTELAFVTTVGEPGFGYAASQVFDYLVDNDVAYSATGAQLEVQVTIDAFADAFKGVDIWWQREVSPAPLTATFNDVPTDHPFFEFVEALAASGITAGCSASPPLFCPDAPLTRKQMAAFLAKALGLYWRY